jgi:hypothetical protein
VMKEPSTLSASARRRIAEIARTNINEVKRCSSHDTLMGIELRDRITRERIMNTVINASDRDSDRD